MEACAGAHFMARRISDSGHEAKLMSPQLEHKHSEIKYVTPDERHQGCDVKILTARKPVYRSAREQHPERWSKEIRNWNHVPDVYLNPEKEAA